MNFKKSTLFLAGAACFSLNAVAQRHTIISPPTRHNIQEQFKPTKKQIITQLRKNANADVANKTTGSGLRLRSMTEWAGNGSVFVRDGDSTTIFWHGNQGEDLVYKEKHLSELFLFDPLVQVFDPNEDIMNTDSSHSYITQSPNSPYNIYDARNIGTIDANQRLIMDTAQYRFNNSWENAERRQLTYSGNGLVLTEQYDYWDSIAWTGDVHYTYTYNSAGALTGVIVQYFNTTLNNFENNEKTEIVYNAGNKPEVITKSQWSNNAWENSTKIVTQYNGTNQPLVQYNLDWNGTAWDSTSTLFVDYTLANQKIISEYDGGYAIPANLVMVYDYQLTGNQVNSIIIKQMDATMNLENVLRYNLGYGSNLLSNITIAQWNGTNWEDGFRYMITFNPQEFITSVSTETYNGTTWVADNSDFRIKMGYESILGVTNVNKAISFSTYPNPATDGVTCISNEKINAVNLIDVTGRVIKKQKFSPAQQVNLSTKNLAAGVYYLQVQTAKGNAIKTISIQP